MDFLQSCTPSLLTPVKNRITSLVSAVETANARNTVVELEKKHLRDAGEARKRKRAGITVGNLGTHVFTTEQCLEKVRDAEAATTARIKLSQWVAQTSLKTFTLCLSQWTGICKQGTLSESDIQ